MARRSNIDLTRALILGAAFEIMEQEGLDALSTRRLAARLSVQGPALYWHIRNKDELLGMMAASIYAEARAAVPRAEGWREWLTHYGLALHEAFRCRRDAARLCSIAKPIGDPREAAGAIAAPLVAFGLPEAKALSYQASVISLALGWAIFEVNGPMHAFLGSFMDLGKTFRTGLDALVEGYSA